MFAKGWKVCDFSARFVIEIYVKVVTNYENLQNAKHILSKKFDMMIKKLQIHLLILWKLTAKISARLKVMRIIHLNFIARTNNAGNQYVPIAQLKNTKSTNEWEELDAVYSCRKDLLISRLSTAKKKVESAEKVKSLYDNNRGKVEQNLISTIQMINKEKQEGVDYLNQVSEEICQTYKNTAEKLTADHDKELQSLQAYIENASECCSISEQLLKENKASFLSVEKTISDKLEIFGSESFEYKKCDVNREQLLLEEKRETLKRKVATLKEDSLRHNDVMQLSIIGVDEKGVTLKTK